MAVQKSPKPLPSLEVGTAYEAVGFERFEYSHASLSGGATILRLHLKNGTTLDLPTSDEALKNLLTMLCDAFGPHAVAHLRSRGWI